VRTTLYLLASLLLLGLGLLSASTFRRWQKLCDRERFFLTMKEITIPKRMSRKEKDRLELLRAHGWLVWRWLPDLWRRRPG
jgi:hypothetical protein